MKYEIEGEAVNQIINTMDEVVDCINSIMSKIGSIQNNITEHNDGATINKLSVVLDNTIGNFKVLSTNVDDFKENIKLYCEKLVAIDEQVIRNSMYKIDTEEVKCYINNVLKIVSQNDYRNYSMTFDNRIEDFHRKVENYKLIENNLQANFSYFGDMQTNYILMEKRQQIEEQIYIQQQNEFVLEEVHHLVANFKGLL